MLSLPYSNWQMDSKYSFISLDWMYYNIKKINDVSPECLLFLFYKQFLFPLAFGGGKNIPGL